MELITPEILKTILRNDGVQDDVESVLSHESEAAVGSGENYCSDIVRLRIKVRLTSGKIFDKTIVLKLFLKQLEANAKIEMKKFFANEVTMYSKILIHLGTLAQQHNFDEPKIWPTCYFANLDAVIFEDLKVGGFHALPRKNGMTLEDAHVVLKFIGRLHGLSITAERRKMIDPSLIRRFYTWVQQDNWTSKYVKKSLYVVGDIVKQWGQQWKEPGQKIQEISNVISQKLNELYTQDVKLKLVNHGDIWISNILVKRDSNNRAVSVRFVDFQNSLYNSCGWELIYYLYTSLPGELMRSNYDQLLSSYRNEFMDTLKKMGENTSIAPTLDEIKSDIERLHYFCLAISCTVMSLAFSTSQHDIQIDDLTENEEKLKALYANDTWESTMKCHIKYFQDHKLF